MTIIPAFILVIFLASPAQAYIDPGTGSFMIQSLLCMALSVGVAVKIYWQRVKEKFKLLFGSRKKP